MDHDYIEAHDVSSRYVAGRLPDGEEREFEAHLVDCPQCIDAVEVEMSLREGLRIVGSESAPQPSARVVPPTSRATTLTGSCRRQRRSCWPFRLGSVRGCLDRGPNWALRAAREPSSSGAPNRPNSRRELSKRGSPRCRRLPTPHRRPLGPNRWCLQRSLP